MRGEDRTAGQLFSYLNVEDWISRDHPLRQVRLLVNDALKALNADFSTLYVNDTGRLSIAPERFLRAMLLQALRDEVRPAMHPEISTVRNGQTRRMPLPPIPMPGSIAMAGASWHNSAKWGMSSWRTGKGSPWQRT